MTMPTKMILSLLSLLIISCSTPTKQENSFLIDGHLLVLNEASRGPSSESSPASEADFSRRVKDFQDRTVELDLSIDKIHGRKPTPKDFHSLKDQKCRLYLFSYYNKAWEKYFYAHQLELDHFLKSPSGIDQFHGMKKASTEHPRKTLRKNPWPPTWVSEKGELPSDPRTYLETTKKSVTYVKANKENPFELIKYTLHMDSERQQLKTIEMEVRRGPKNLPYEEMAIDTLARCSGKPLVSYHRRKSPLVAPRQPASLKGKDSKN